MEKNLEIKNFFNMEEERKIWEDIGQNIKNLIKIGFSIIFVKFFWVWVGSIILFLFMIPGIKSGDLEFWQAIIGSLIGGLLGYYLSPKK